MGENSERWLQIRFKTSFHSIEFTNLLSDRQAEIFNHKLKLRNHLITKVLQSILLIHQEVREKGELKITDKMLERYQMIRKELSERKSQAALSRTNSIPLEKGLNEKKKLMLTQTPLIVHLTEEIFNVLPENPSKQIKISLQQSITNKRLKNPSIKRKKDEISVDPIAPDTDETRRSEYKRLKKILRKVRYMAE